MVEAADHPALGRCLDSFHILARGSDPKGIEDIPGEKIFFLQLADAPLMAMDVLQWSRHYRCFPGQGGFDVAGLVAARVRAGYGARSRWKCSTTCSGRPRRGRPPSTPCVRCSCSRRPRASARRPRPVVPTGIAFAELVTPDAEPRRGAARRARLRPHRAGTAQAGRPVGAGRGPRPGQHGPCRRPRRHSLAASAWSPPDPPVAAGAPSPCWRPCCRAAATSRTPRSDAVAAPDGTELFFCATDRPGLPSWLGDFVPVASPDSGRRRR